MGRKTLPTGVTVRQYASGREVIRVNFTWNGRSCREVLNIEPTRDNIQYAANLLGSVRLAILQKTFDYATFFPDSPFVKQQLATVGAQVKDRMDRMLATGKWEKSTYTDRLKKFHNHIEPVFGHLAPTEITPALVKDWLRGLRGVLNAHTAGTTISLLRPVLNDAVVEGLIPRNPMEHIKVNEFLATRTTAARKEAIDPLDEEEITRLLACVTRHETRNLFTVALFTGLRRQELPLLRWENVDWRRHKLMVDTAVGLDGNDEYHKETKTGDSRLVDLVGPAWGALQDQRALTELKSPYIFLDSRTNKPFQMKSLYWSWKYALKKARLRYRPVKQTRHTFCSLMLSRGENIFWVANQAGHSDLRMMQKHYAKWIDRGQETYQTANDWGHFCPVTVPVSTDTKKAPK